MIPVITKICFENRMFVKNNEEFVNFVANVTQQESYQANAVPPHPFGLFLYFCSSSFSQRESYVESCSVDAQSAGYTNF